MSVLFRSRGDACCQLGHAATKMMIVTSSPALVLAEWLCATAPRRPDALTHLKLQKLAFYAYGALLAHDIDSDLGDVEFQAWPHGPVSTEIYSHFASYGAAPLPADPSSAAVSERCAAVIADTVAVYGRLTAWQIREESHLEEPWVEVFDGRRDVPIPTERLRQHFRSKFTTGKVRFPERLFGGSSLQLDRIPVPEFSTLHDMAVGVERILGSAP
jgi:uncharacterized phage-associated protein